MWVKDPVTKIESVSLTLSMVISFFTISLGVLQAFNKINNTGPFLEMFWSSWALYLGRRINLNGKIFSSEKEEKNEEKVIKE
jgi:hypothetical protein